MKTISVVLAEDHHVVRQGLRALLAAEADLEVVGEAASGLDVGDLVERHQLSGAAMLLSEVLRAQEALAGRAVPVLARDDHARALPHLVCDD